MTTVRVVLVADAFHPAVDEATATVRAVADRLLESGHEVAVLAPVPGLASYRGASVRRLDPAAARGAQIRQALVDLRPDVVLAIGAGARRTLTRSALERAGRLGIRTVALQTTAVADRDWDRWRAAVAEHADRLLVTSPWLADELAGRGVGAETWLPGVDVDAFSPALRDGALHDSWARARAARGRLVVVGHVGRLRKRHDVRRLVELSAVPGIRPVLIGAGAQRDWLAARLPGAALVGELETGARATAIASLDLLVQPGERETCCTALREAAASGVAVVAPRAGGARHVVRHLETGVCYDPAEPRGLARAVAAVAADRHRGLMGAQARRVALGRTWRVAVDELLALHLRPTPGTLTPESAHLTLPSR